MASERQDLEESFSRIEAEEAKRQAVVAHALKAPPELPNQGTQAPSRAPSIRRQANQAAQQWEYLFAEFGWAFDWLLMGLDHKDAPKPLHNMSMADFSMKAGAEGWELVSSTLTGGNLSRSVSLIGLASLGAKEKPDATMLLIFKRPKL
jgi:hypothetical protein